MKRFDCLDTKCPLFGPHLLEASAGTGKTFAIEHVVTRLLLAKVPLQKILVVTFTRAATRELKERIFASLSKALSAVKGEAHLPHLTYLNSLIGSKEAAADLSGALKMFDQSQVFTIHGFCQRMLKEFAFEAERWAPLEQDDHPVEKIHQAVSALKEFLREGLSCDEVCPEQVALLLHTYDTLYEWASALLKASPKQEGIGFRALKEKTVFLGPNHSIREDFAKMRGQYKAAPEDVDEQFEWVIALVENPLDDLPFRKLIQAKGTLFSFLDPKNRKVKAAEAPLVNREFWDWFHSVLAPTVLEAANPKRIFLKIAARWKEWEKKKTTICFQPDDLLDQMKSALNSPLFSQEVKKKYRAVIIDEFQDTDPLQWEIFESLFLDAETLYLVGDPKQSIYRFRNADVYTYLAAKERLGAEHLYHLDTNFRSSKELISALNTLFSRKWMKLPKRGETLPYLPVLAGSCVSSDLQDEKKALHWILGGELSSYDDTFLPYAVQEILRLGQLAGVAILVKDRYELQSALNLLKEFGIPCIARSHERLVDTYAFHAVKELFTLLASPRSEKARSAVEAGPWGESDKSWEYWQKFVLEEGLAQFFSAFCRVDLEDLTHVLEELFAWEAREGFSFEGIQTFFADLAALEGADAPMRRTLPNNEAVQVMTLHMSKGLEFEIVFALSLASSTTSEEEEAEEWDAEKLRQLYVAMTRAKKRLYVPIHGATKPSKKTSPIALLSECIEKEEGSFVNYLRALEKQCSVSIEEVPSPFPITLSKRNIEEKMASQEAPLPSVSFKSCYIESFTSLAKTREQETLPFTEASEFPHGKEVGVLIHQVFENIFAQKTDVWKEEQRVQEIVEETLLYTFLAPWISEVQAIVCKTLSLPLAGFSLKDLSLGSVAPEVKFLYIENGTYIQGCIDLVFVHEEKLYFIDWKTNRLQRSVEEEMQAHDYPLQASLYKQALLKYFPFSWGGAFYLFVRKGEVFCIQ